MQTSSHSILSKELSNTNLLLSTSPKTSNPITFLTSFIASPIESPSSKQILFILLADIISFSPSEDLLIFESLTSTFPINFSLLFPVLTLKSLTYNLFSESERALYLINLAFIPVSTSNSLSPLLTSNSVQFSPSNEYSITPFVKTSVSLLFLPIRRYMSLISSASPKSNPMNSSFCTGAADQKPVLSLSSNI